MSIFLGILLTILVLLIVVMIHEFGHFITARMTGMRVDEFGVGIPPRARTLYLDNRGTEYTLNWLPIGGFVRIYGENHTDHGATHARDSFMHKKWPSRVLVLSAGVIMNFVLAYLIFVGLFVTGVSPVTVLPQTANQSLLMPGYQDALASGLLTMSGIQVIPVTGGIAEHAGVQSGSLLLSIGGVTPSTMDDVIHALSKNESIELSLQDVTGKRYVVSIIPVGGKIGIQMNYAGLTLNKEYTIQQDLGTALITAAQEVVVDTRITLGFMRGMIVGLFAPKTEMEHTEAKNMLSGPIGMSAMFVGIVENNIPFSVIALITALISINLGIVNILPLPALDGGRIVTTTIYSLVSHFPRIRRHFPRIEGGFHAIGFGLFLMLMIYVAGLDVSRFF